MQRTIKRFEDQRAVHSHRHQSAKCRRCHWSRADVTRGERDCIAHLTKLLRRCIRLPEIGDARVHDRVFQNGYFSRNHVRRLQAGVVSSLRGGCAEQRGRRNGRISIRSSRRLKRALEHSLSVIPWERCDWLTANCTLKFLTDTPDEYIKYTGTVHWRG